MNNVNENESNSREKKSVFRSAEGREKIRNYYNHILGFCPCKQYYVTTSCGETFCLEAGDDTKPVVLLLHGSCSNTAAWLGDFPVLAQSYRVIAIDLPGEPGNSEDNRLSFVNNEYADWLKELMDQLKIKKASVIGNSMGGWMALKFAVIYPDNVEALGLIAASGIVPPPDVFLEQTTKINETTSENEASDTILNESGVPKEVLEFMKLIMDNFIPFTGGLPLMTDDQLKRLTMPVLFVAGKNDTTMSAVKAEERIKRFVSRSETKIIEGAHIIMNSSDMVVPFLQRYLQ